MKYVLGAVLGLIWGALAALLNTAINKNALKKNTTNAVLAARGATTAVDILALALVFLLRKVLPVSYEAMLVGTAIALSIITIVMAFRLARPDPKPTEPQEDAEEKE